MKSIRHLRIGQVIGIGFGLILLLALVIALLGRIAYDINNWQSNIIQTRGDVERLSLQLEIVSAQRVDALDRYLENNDVTFLANYQTTQAAYNDIFSRLQILLHSPEEIQSLHNVIDAEAGFSRKVDEILALYDDFPAAALFLWDSEGIISQRNLLSSIGNLRKIQGETSASIIDDARKTEDLAIIAISIFIPLLLIVGVITSWFIARSITNPISNLVDTTTQLGNDLTVRGKPSGPKEIYFLADTINQMGDNLYNSRLSLQAHSQRLEHEMNLASQIQASFLPATLPQSSHLELAVFWKSAREVGGDFYAHIDLQNGRRGIAVGDVSGKGTPAAMVGSLSVGLLDAYAMHHPNNPEKLLDELNRDLCIRLSSQSVNVACCYAILDADNRCLSVANAGCMYPYLWRNGSVSEIMARGLPLGAWGEFEYVAQTASLQAGDLLIFSSDGLVEAQNAEGELLGFERIQNQIMSFSPDVNAQNAVDNLAKTALDFTGSDDLHDDITILAVRLIA